jgi:hypothetical protein
MKYSYRDCSLLAVSIVLPVFSIKREGSVSEVPNDELATLLERFAFPLLANAKISATMANPRKTSPIVILLLYLDYDKKMKNKPMIKNITARPNNQLLVEGLPVAFSIRELRESDLPLPDNFVRE